MRLRKRTRCSSFERLRKIFTIRKPLRERYRSQSLISSYLRFQMPCSRSSGVSSRRQPLLVAAQEVLIELARGGDLEALDPHTLGVDATHHVPDRPVLPAASSAWSTTTTPYLPT